MSTPDDLTLWPPAALRVVSGDLELRWADDETLYRLAREAGRGVHDESVMPFLTPWTRGTPEQIGRSLLQYQWGQRARLTPDDWALELAVCRDGEVLGMQGVFAQKFRVTRVAETGSWLGRRFHGQGVGTRMRLLALHLVFDGLGARAAENAAFLDNGPSTGVTHKLGYRDNGVRTLVREGVSADERRFRMDRADWDARPADLRTEVAMSGIEAVRELLDIH